MTEIDAQSYSAFVSDRKRKIAEARYCAGLSVNRELILLYCLPISNFLEEYGRFLRVLMRNSFRAAFYSTMLAIIRQCYAYARS